MKHAKKRQRRSTLALIYLSAGVIVFGVLAGTYYEKNKQLERYAHNSYQHAFGELVTAVSEMDTALEKSLYATTPNMVGAVCTEVFGKAMVAQMSLGALPFGSEELEQTAGFLSRVGDYAFCLSRASTSGGGYSEEELENLHGLSETAGVLALNLRSLQEELLSGTLTMQQLQRGAQTLESGAQGESGAGNLGDSIRLIEQEFPELPSLVYDGPFSEHLQNAVPKMLAESEEVDAERAREIAAGFLNLSKARVYPTEECGGTIPCYGFAADEEGGAQSFIAITKQGGRVLSMVCSRPVGSERIGAEDAAARAQRFLKQNGFSGMEETYHMTQGGIMTFNFAYRQGEVLCYSDLVKVAIALDTGRVCGFEAQGYLNAHCTRALPAAELTAEQARAQVGAGLEILAEQLCLVPSDGKYETLCYEFKCAAENERHYLIYVNAVSGAQEKILILLEDESGTLAI